MYAAVKALIEKDGNILMVKVDTGDFKIWVPPGGRISYGESPIEALKREVEGETSLDIVPGDPLDMYHFFIGSGNDGDQVTLTVFEVESYAREVDIDTEHGKEDGIVDYDWFRPEEILELEASEGFKDIIRDKILKQ